MVITYEVLKILFVLISIIRHDQFSKLGVNHVTSLQEYAKPEIVHLSKAYSIQSHSFTTFSVSFAGDESNTQHAAPVPETSTPSYKPFSPSYTPTQPSYTPYAPAPAAAVSAHTYLIIFKCVVFFMILLY